MASLLARLLLLRLVLFNLVLFHAPMPATALRGLLQKTTNGGGGGGAACGSALQSCCCNLSQVANEQDPSCCPSKDTFCQVFNPDSADLNAPELTLCLPLPKVGTRRRQFCIPELAADLLTSTVALSCIPCLMPF